MEQNKMLELASKFEKATLEDILELFNPANAQALPNEVLDLMQNLSDERIQALAERYPNGATGNTYLVLKDTKVQKQLFTRSTWANLHGLRTAGGLKNFVALTFTSRFKGDAVSKPATLKYSDTQDLTKDETKNLQGLKVSEPQTSKPVSSENTAGNSQEAQGGAVNGLVGTNVQNDFAGQEGQKNEVVNSPKANSFIDEDDNDDLGDFGEGKDGIGDVDDNIEIEGDEDETKVNTRGQKSAAPKKLAAAKKAAAKKAVAPKKAH